MKKFLKGRWFPLAVVSFVAFVLFLCGFRITYVPELKTNMNVIFENIACVIVAFVVVIVVVRSLKRDTDKRNKAAITEEKYGVINANILKVKRIWNWWLRHNNAAFYWFALILLTKYVILNWNTCISMHFFQNFNGNNILFLCWILMIFLKIFRIKVKDIEIFRELQQGFMAADLQYSINERQQLISQEEQTITDGDREEVRNNA